MSMKFESEHFPVVIIDAGISGLAAANILFLNNISFVIVEPQDYIGGRVKSIDISNIIIDFV